MDASWMDLQYQCKARWEARGLTKASGWAEFGARVDAEFPRLAGLLWALYSDRPDFAFFVEDLVACLFTAYAARPEPLKVRDRTKTPESGWFLGADQVGAVCYVDRFAGTFRGLEGRIPYLKELGISYLHLMPFFLSPEAENDGGYAVSDYRKTDPRLGSMDDLEHLARVLDAEGITLVADFVFNHTGDDHPWTRSHPDYYWQFDTKEETAPWQSNLRDIFPEVRKGSFTWRPEIRKWVWTTFHSFQWDLNYRNPAVFSAMAGEMVGLANRGVGVLRLDAVAFVWKQPGTNCENLPEAHTVIQAFQAVARLVCPSLLFKSEAIVHPDDILKYIGPRECQLSYNPLLMAELWEAAATKETRLLNLSLKKRHALPPGTAWVNYVRCHDDIGWTFADEDAASLGINGYDHRQFLNRFYTGDFPGTFARGVGFQFNPETGDRRICGAAASLAGIERARVENLGPAEKQMAVDRLRLLYTVAYMAGGVPLLYLGDEVAVENDYSYGEDPAHAADNRWVHRPRWSDDLAARRHDQTTTAGTVFQTLVRLAAVRRENPVAGVQGLEVLETSLPSVLAFRKTRGNVRLTLVGNFGQEPVTLDGSTVRRLLGTGIIRDLLAGNLLKIREELVLGPCGTLLTLTTA